MAEKEIELPVEPLLQVTVPVQELAFNETTSPGHTVLLVLERLITGALGRGLVEIDNGVEMDPVQPFDEQLAVIVIGSLTVNVIGLPVRLLLQLTVPVQPTAFTEILPPTQITGRPLIASVGVIGTAFTVSLLLETGLVASGFVAKIRILKLDPDAKEVGIVAVKEPLPFGWVGKLINCPAPLSI
ncbi:MAG: hypothetical protein NWP83_08640 [Spirosomaceae bacterium]|nr:hypothetical protein [Spirosomataceae bacterium]